MKDAKLACCIVINSGSYRTAHTAAEAYSAEMISRLNYRNSKSATSETDLRNSKYSQWGSEATLRRNKAYKRIHPIFKNLFKAN